MATAFSNRITSLRKERGLSQKEVAMSLGVSQALLSHYEKGVRECGLDFVLKCAEYYGVTTDYLLGKDDSRHGIYEALAKGANNPEDLSSEKVNLRTILLCISLFAERFSTTDPKLGDKLLWGAAIAEYKLLVACLSAGRFSEDCLDTKIRWDDQMFQHFVSAVFEGLFEPNRTIPPAKIDNNKLPPFANTLVKGVEEYVSQLAAGYLNKDN